MWHIVVFVFAVSQSPNTFLRCVDVGKVSFSELKKKISFYENILKIKKWKDMVPQFSSKSFSKKNLESLDLKYLLRFVAETLRGEWNHAVCCTIIPFLFFITDFFSALSFSFLVILANLPCVFIQRYNRARLYRLVIRLTRA
jgi:glycosyl-4,4'-diaponeurosporenoate acyltransferase